MYINKTNFGGGLLHYKKWNVEIVDLKAVALKMQTQKRHWMAIMRWMVI